MEAFAATLLLVTLHLTTTSAHAKQDGCLITETSCPCSISTSSRSCIRREGLDKCLMDVCKPPRYKCDCLGYEICKLSTCQEYWAAAGEIASSDTPFRCHLRANSGICTAFEAFRDSIDAANNAKAAATQSVQERVLDLTVNLNAVQEIQGYGLEALQMAHRLDTYAEAISEADRKDVDRQFKSIVNLWKLVQAETERLQTAMSETIAANLHAGHFQRVCRRLEQDSEALAERLVDEEVKHGSRRSCDACTQLREEFKRLRLERGRMAVMTGMWTKAAQTAKDQCSAYREAINKIHANVTEAHVHCMQRADSILSLLPIYAVNIS